MKTIIFKPIVIMALLLQVFFTYAREDRLTKNQDSIALVLRQDSLLKVYPVRNAYELAHRLYQYQKQDFRADEYKKVKISLLNSIKNYIDTRPDSIVNYPLLHSTYRQIANEIYPPERLLNKTIGGFDSATYRINGNHKEIYSRLKEFHTKYNSLSPYISALKTRYTKDSAVLVSKTMELRSSKLKDSSADLSSQTSEIDILKSSLSALDEDIATMTKMYQDTIAKQFMSFYDSNFVKIENSFPPKLTNELINYRATSEDVDKKTTDIINNIQYQIDQTSTAASFSLPTQAEMIDALAIYLADRMKQETVMWFFDQIKKNTERYELIREFFPNTVRLLQGNEVYEIPNMGALWQYALSKDFMLMPRQVVNSQWLETRAPEIVKYRGFITGACDMADLTMQRYSYRDAIKSMYLAGADKKNISNTLSFHDIVSMLYAINTELFVPDSNVQYRMLGFEDYRRMKADEMILMLSLVDIKYNGPFKKIFNLHSDKTGFGLGNERISFGEMQVLLGRIEASVANFEKMRTEFVKKEKQLQANGAKDWVFTSYSVWSSLTNLLDVMELSKEDSRVFTPLVQNNNKAFKYAGCIYTSYDLITKKNYAGAVQTMLGLIDSVLYRNGGDSLYSFNLKDPTKKDIFKSSKLLQKILAGDLSDSLFYQFHVNDDNILFSKQSLMASVFFDKDRHAVQLINKLSGFLNDAALAQSDKQLAKVVESYAMPVGSYKRKRNHWLSLDLNAFAGPYYGYEWVKTTSGTNTNNSNRNAKVYGFSAPIGLSFSRTKGRRLSDNPGYYSSHKNDIMRNPDLIKLKKHHVYYRTKSTLTTTLSIIDLGAVVSYRLSNTDSVLPQSVKWEQFISPGLHLAWGIPGTPLVISSGVQYTPLLRRINDGSDMQYNALRIYGGIYFDMPLLNLWESRYRIIR